MKNVIFFVLITLFPIVSFASNIAIIDSGTDLRHMDLMKKAWINPGEVAGNNADDESNGYVDDINGWNFAENNNQIIDYKYLGTFSPDVYKFFDVQYKLMAGTATDEDKKWYKEKREDQNFIKELSKFGNFIHGTHVAGITANNAELAKIMGVKIIPTESGLVFEQAVGDLSQLQTADGEEISPMTDMLIKMGLSALADQQMKVLTSVGEYVGKMSMKVANCSFGTSMEQAKMIVQAILKLALNREPTEQEIETYAKFFMDQVVEKGKAFVGAAKETLFVIAAGNDGANNDVSPASPANVKENNTITVAASFGYQKLASFSNYGTKMVEVAAPGVGINSAIPGNEYLRVSGTSQATPFVANVIGQIMDINPDLGFAEIKRIVMETVDKKDFLKDKVTSGGIVNSERALEAARLSVDLAVTKAIKTAIEKVADVAEPKTNRTRFEGYVIPLSPMFY